MELLGLLCNSENNLGEAEKALEDTEDGESFLQQLLGLPDEQEVLWWLPTSRRHLGKNLMSWFEVFPRGDRAVSVAGWWALGM